ncbi:MAG: MBL fold metallo-hydrolase [Chitinophagaceae bacterium]
MPAYPLSEGVFTIGRDKIFVPFDVEKHILNERPIGSLLVEVQPFLVVAGEEVLVLDTGLGFKNSEGEMQLHANIRKAGYTPDQVTKVLISHLHKDHAGGLMQVDANGIQKPSFSNAQYFIYRPEADFALASGSPSYHPEKIEPILSSGQVVWLDGNEGRINEHISFRHTGAHCPQHIVYLIDDEHTTHFFGGDEAPQWKQIKMKYVAKYDFDGKKAMHLRMQWAEEGKKAHWNFLFYHDVKTPMMQM